MEDFVRCNTCFREYYDVIYPGSEQAYMCASVVTEKGIRGEYGSIILDGTMGVFGLYPEAKRPEGVNLGVICDECILKLQEQELLVHSERGYAYIGQTDDEFLKMFLKELEEVNNAYLSANSTNGV
jgi:hypothetical protein